VKARIKWSKTGVLKFIGHLDVQRYFHKAMMRAELPVSFSRGMSPHQIMSFAAPLGIGMTIFLFISWVWPNGLDLRPETFPRDNFFTGLVADLYQRDTSTNVFPSIHVYNSVVAFIAINRCKALRKRKVIRAGAFVLSTLIILSTVFLKQHSVADVLGAFVMNAVLYVIIYRPELLPGRVKKTAVE